MAPKAWANSVVPIWNRLNTILQRHQPESCPTRLWEKSRLANGELAIRIIDSLSAYVMHGSLFLTAVKPPSAGRQNVVPSTYIASIMYNDPVRVGAGSFFGAPQ
ncbi:hypothetical protein MGU_04573 [Metarhizium guizhouense ARSEF 977]|uniref:Uncharacterized protein n=1 Tax=Metarhizium guizhouense (strain ARSEF 977) TaxID=1276136 RepID=A0A0B4H0P2_METGA|nr:hypothetical protein MGU_04573 [Metarhizium guizhouense ARSEF 977]